MKIDIVIPVFNEQMSLPLLWEEIKTIATAHDLDVRVIFVDDHSTDSSWEVIESICRQQQTVIGIRLGEHSGKTAALKAGFSQCCSEFVFTMDADLQDDPNEIPKFIERLRSGADLVCGWKKDRQDNRFRRWLSHGFNRSINLATGMKLHDHNCGFKALKGSRLYDLVLDRGMHRFFTVMVFANQGEVAEVVVNHRARQFGRSKYGWGRIPRGFRDLFKVLVATRCGRRRMRPSPRSEQQIEISEILGPAMRNDRTITHV